MFAAWGRRMYRWRRATLAISALLLAISVATILRGGTLTTGTIANIEADRALHLIERELGQPGGASFTVIYHSDTAVASDPAFRDALLASLVRLRADARVASVRTPYDPLPPELTAGLVAPDAHRALAIVDLRDDFKTSATYYPALRDRVHAPGLDLLFTGPLAFKSDLDHVLARDQLRAELVSGPLALIVLLLVFGTLTASSLPIAVGALAVVGGVAGVFALSRHTDVAQYALNITTLIGLGVAIDYSLFIVNRFREELARGQSVEDAVSHATATAGRAVTYSGVAVAIGLSGLLFYPRSYLSAMGMAGAIVVFLAVFYSLTFLPALMGVLGQRVNSLRIPMPRIHLKAGFWRRVATRVMRRPVMVLLPTLVFMLAVGTPFLHLRMATADIHALPARAEARRGYAVLEQHFPDQVRTRIAVAVRFPGGSVLAPARVAALHALSRRAAALPGVERVQSIVDLDPRMGLADYQTLWSTPREYLPGPMQLALRQGAGEHLVVLSVLTPEEPASPRARAIVRALRSQRAVADGELLIAGQTANDLDTTDFIVQHTPLAVAFVALMTLIVLFLLLGSVVLPIKAVLMNLLSITGSFGALVWIFQDGHLHRVLGFNPGPIEPTLPVVLFCTVFGLSMDYEVLLLSRMQEEYKRTHDNTRAVAEGLERSGRLITSAAAIMVAVFVAFSLAEVVLIKAVGLGMAVAVALDATLVRLLIVPSTMRLFGDLNWWAPKPLARLYHRLGFGEASHH